MEENRFWESIKHFKPEDFSAPEDLKSGYLMNHFLVMSLDEVRSIIGHPIIIHGNGAYAFKGHSDNSFHYLGEATDFHVVDWSLSPRGQMRVILDIGSFGGVGFYPDWKPVPGFHVDVRRMFQIWKKENGIYTYFFSGQGPLIS